MAEIGIRKTHDNLKAKLSDYIKAQYFAENDLLMGVSEDILSKRGVIFQEPFIEIAKSYKQSAVGFDEADLDEKYKEILNEMAEKKLGVFKTPFNHQIQAVESFYANENVLVTTGTGSGKTECFLWPILTNLIYESRYNSDSWEKEGIRALVLYPMNALVSDQLGRMRNIIGCDKEDAYHKILSGGKICRRARFGMYTGRTPYAGENDEVKNKNLAKVMTENYLNNSAYEELKKIGRIPSKDLKLFVNNLSRGIQKTGENDSELYTRNEMQKICPDVLITNYSMLEYMLMRPIEDSFWRKTIEWLNSAEDNKLLLVIDEAHMYRGAPGGEVSLLIRRLMDRLSINETKMRCILTSASMPENSDDTLQKFVNGLTGMDTNSRFAIIREQLEKVFCNKKGAIEGAEFFASLSLENLQGDISHQMIEMKRISVRYRNFEPIKTEYDIRLWLYNVLKDEPIIKQILVVCGKGAKALSDIAKEIFEDDVPVKLSERALENILQLGIMAKSDTGKVLLGSKVHMLFRGLQGLYACSNPNCSHATEGMGVKLGYVTTENRDICPKCNARMFEIMMDRKCGTLYFRAYIDKQVQRQFSFEFLWPRKNKILKKPEEIHIWPIPNNRTDFFKINKKNGKAKDKAVVSYLDSKTGMLFKDETHAGEDGFLKVLVSEYYDENNAATFGTCPNCGKDYNKITDFATRGNEPFANIVREQFESQVIKDAKLKNDGKKVLLFSDSRQRAAKLARDMTIASDGDAGRQAIFLAQKLLSIGRDTSKTINLIYYAFLKVVYDNQLNFFYGEEKERFKNHLKKYKEFYSDIDESRISFNSMKDNIGKPPMMFYQLLLKNISDSYRSYNNLGLAQIVLAESGLAGDHLEEDVLERVEMLTNLSIEDIRNIYNTWVQYLVVTKIAVFPDVTDDVRNSILSYERGGFGIDEESRFPDFMKEIFKTHNVDDEKIKILLNKFEGLIERLDATPKVHNRRYILGARLELKTAENAKWYKCDRCAGMSTYTLWGHCIYCGSDKHIRSIDKEHLQRYSLWTKPVFDAISGERTKNITTEEHTAQLSYKDTKKEVWGTTEKYELAFRNISLGEDDDIVDVLSCTTTMEVGIDIGSLTSVGLRNVPPMIENYQQRAGRAGRAGAAVSSIVTYTENGPHDAWYFKHPHEIISGEPRKPWIDTNNKKLVKRHINLILLQEYLREKHIGLDNVYTIDFFNEKNIVSYVEFWNWLSLNIPFETNREKTLIPIKNFNWYEYKKELILQLSNIKKKVDEAEFVYKPITDDEYRSNSYKLMDVLFSEGILPNYSFPRNIVNFWIEDLHGKVKESPERSIDIALSEYAPGRSIVVNKQTYISGGLFNYYTKFQKENRLKAAAPWLELEENKKSVQCCSKRTCGWFGVNEDYDCCPLCGHTLERHPMIRPWGFAAREGRNIPETQDNQEMSSASKPSYASMPSGNEMQPVGMANYIGIENRENQKLVIVNKGPDDKGFELCYECGAIEPATVSEKERMQRKRPYRIPSIKDDSMKCRRHDYKNIYLGYEFNTDMMVMEIKLDESKLDLSVDYNIWLLSALTTFSETLALAASRELDVEFNDMKSGFRIRTVGNQLYADVYLYDSLSSGAGYAGRVTNYIDSVMRKMEEILIECDCSKACPNCLQHFGNQRERDNLDRFLGLDFLKFIRDGKLRRQVSNKDQEIFVSDLNNIARLHGMDEIIINKSGNYYLRSDFRDIEIVFYPAMCNMYKQNNNNKFFVSDRMCKYGISDVWRSICEKL